VMAEPVSTASGDLRVGAAAVAGWSRNCRFALAVLIAGYQFAVEYLISPFQRNKLDAAAAADSRRAWAQCSPQDSSHKSSYRRL